MNEIERSVASRLADVMLHGLTLYTPTTGRAVRTGRADS